MAKITDMELYQALLTIQQYCRGKLHCEECSMCNEYSGDCQFTMSTAENPSNWSLKEPPTGWKVFDVG